MLDLNVLAEELDKVNIKTKWSLRELLVGFYSNDTFITIAKFYNESKGTVLSAFTPTPNSCSKYFITTGTMYARFNWFGAYLNKWECDRCLTPLEKATEAEIVKFFIEPYCTFMYTLTKTIDKESDKARETLIDLGFTERSLSNTYELQLIDDGELKGTVLILAPRVRVGLGITCIYEITVRDQVKEIKEKVSHARLDDVVAYLLGERN